MVTLTNVTFSGCTGANGGAIYVEPAGKTQLQITNCTFSNNVAEIGNCSLTN
jgi:predicted outer membrane repeat protein